MRNNVLFTNQLGVFNMKIMHLSIDKINWVEGRNPRFNYGELNELADSIQKQGVIHPGIVEKKDKKYFLISGHRRYKALELLKAKGVEIQFPVEVRENLSETDMLSLMLATNTGKPFEPLEESELFHKLHKIHGLAIGSIAKKIGRSSSYVTQRMQIMQGGQTLKDAVKNKDITPQDAAVIVRKTKSESNPKQRQDKIVEQIKEIKQKDKPAQSENVALAPELVELKPLTSAISEPSPPKQEAPVKTETKSNKQELLFDVGRKATQPEPESKPVEKVDPIAKKIAGKLSKKDKMQLAIDSWDQLPSLLIGLNCDENEIEKRLKEWTPEYMEKSEEIDPDIAFGYFLGRLTMYNDLEQNVETVEELIKLLEKNQ